MPIVAALVLLCLQACALSVLAQQAAWHLEPILPIPQAHSQDEAKAALGERLFHDVRLSGNDSVSCATCHPLSRGGADGLARSIGVNGATGDIKAPTVFNSRFNLAQFWNGRAKSLEEQVQGPVHNPVEMDSSWDQVMHKLSRDAAYVRDFSRLYKDAITAENIQDAIAVFERTLITANSPFDRWLRGDQEALNAAAQRGFGLFKSYGCVACHQGVNMGGNMYQRMGIMGDYFVERGRPLGKADLGRFSVTGDQQDRHLFKVPSLRLAAVNPPYFHDGSATSLQQAIRVMAKYQLGRNMPPEDVADIEAFLRSVVGTHPRFSP